MAGRLSMTLISLRSAGLQLPRPSRCARLCDIPFLVCVVMALEVLREGSLVLYRAQQARVARAGEKLLLELPNGENARVRPKDVVLLHPGPLERIEELEPATGEVEAAWEILAGTTTTLQELAELAFGEFTPTTAWAAWQRVADGLYFRGTPDGITARTPDELARIRASRAADESEKKAWADFVGRAGEGQVADVDARFWREVEAVALKRSSNGRVLRALGREETPEAAHQLLLDASVWDETVNPHPIRLGVALEAPAMAAGFEWPPAEERLDLTEMPAFAIDDALTETPDDAVSFAAVPGIANDEEMLWVHVADPAAVITPGSALDTEARNRGATLHLPERRVPMLPPEAAPIFGLGLSDRSPALSFGLALAADGVPELRYLGPSWIRVTRLTYEQGEERLNDEPLARIHELAQVYERRRERAGRIAITLPEATVRVADGIVSVEPVRELGSRVLVENAMIMTGEATARFATAVGIALPYATQEPPEFTGASPIPEPSSMAGMYALRRSMKRSQYRTSPGRHAGLGLDAYVQATSPLRRYLDLVVHQQLRAYLRLRDDPQVPTRLLEEAEILQLIGSVDGLLSDTRSAENLSNRHWTLVALQRTPDFSAEGVVVERRGSNTTFLLPEWVLETQLREREDRQLGSRVTLSLRSVDLPRLDARFRVE